MRHSAGPPGIEGRVAISSVIDPANVRAEFSADFVPQTDAGIDSREARADLTFRIALAVKVRLRLRLQNPPLCDHEIPRTVDPASQVSPVAEVERRLEIEEVRSEPFSAESSPKTRRAGVCVGANPGLRIEVARMRGIGRS